VSFVCWFITLNLKKKYPFQYCILNINIFWLKIYFISCILYIHAIYHMNMNNIFLKHIFKIHNFQGQKHFWAKCAQFNYKEKIYQFKSFFRSNYQFKHHFQFSKWMLHIWYKKKTFEKKQKLSIFKVWVLWTCNFLKNLCQALNM